MKKTRCLLTSICIVLTTTACKKQPEVKISSRNAALIVGKWVANQQHTLIYSLDNNTLLKDTIINYGATGNVNWWYEMYNADGNAFVTGKAYRQNGILKADTTSFLKYTINGSNMLLKPYHKLLIKNRSGLRSDFFLLLFCIKRLFYKMIFVSDIQAPSRAR